jgi:hypothetical protein
VVGGALGARAHHGRNPGQRRCRHTVDGVVGDDQLVRLGRPERPQVRQQATCRALVAEERDYDRDARPGRRLQRAVCGVRANRSA